METGISGERSKADASYAYGQSQTKTDGQGQSTPQQSSELDPKTPTQKVPDPATSSPVRSAKEVFALSDLRDLEPDSPVQTDPMPRLQNGSTVEGS
jgi:hypothetical protein